MRLALRHPFGVGVKIFHIPTTTLAAIDAAWGGKTALNWKKVKNQIGTIHPPVAVHIDARWLTTLPEREFRAGLAEAAKHAMIDSKSLSISLPLLWPLHKATKT